MKFVGFIWNFFLYLIIIRDNVFVKDKMVKPEIVTEL